MSPCPQEVVETGRLLIEARKLARALSDKIDDTLDQLDLAVEVMTEKYGAKAMQAGTAIIALRTAQAAYGHVMEGHESLRQVLIACNVEQPTDAQVASIR